VSGRSKPNGASVVPGEQPTALVADGDPGKLTTPAGEELAVRVAERRDDVLLLVLMLEPGDLLDAAGSESLGLQCTSAGGIVRFRGEVDLEHHDLVRFRVTDVVEVLQRREFFRVRAPQRVAVFGEDVGALHTFSIDVSGSGMLLSGPETLKLDSRSRFEIDLFPGEPPIEGRARVVRVGAGGQRAVVFEEIPRYARERLIHFLFDRQRAERAITRRASVPDPRSR
jgi:PilZ domain-containing protein